LIINGGEITGVITTDDFSKIAFVNSVQEVTR
jgi:hypothetical protein